MPLAIAALRSSLEIEESLNFFFKGNCSTSLFHNSLLTKVSKVGQASKYPIYIWHIMYGPHVLVYIPDNGKYMRRGMGDPLLSSVIPSLNLLDNLRCNVTALKSWNIMSLRSSIAFRSGDRESQSLVSSPSSCTRRPHCTGVGSDSWSKDSIPNT